MSRRLDGSHDVNLAAARYCDRITALKSGRIVWEGLTGGLMDARVLESTYETPMTLVAAPEAGGPFAFAASARTIDR